MMERAAAARKSAAADIKESSMERAALASQLASALARCEAAERAAAAAAANAGALEGKVSAKECVVRCLLCRVAFARAHRAVGIHG
jgi:hypothetical protein